MNDDREQMLIEKKRTRCSAEENEKEGKSTGPSARLSGAALRWREVIEVTRAHERYPRYRSSLVEPRARARRRPITRGRRAKSGGPNREAARRGGSTSVGAGAIGAGLERTSAEGSRARREV